MHLPWATQPCLQDSQVRRHDFAGEKHSQGQLGVVQRIAWKQSRGGAVDMYCKTRR